jgi:hypothetical protein
MESMIRFIIKYCCYSGLAIAGEGGVASSKPVATAVVGPGGLAVSGLCLLLNSILNHSFI